MIASNDAAQGHFHSSVRPLIKEVPAIELKWMKNLLVERDLLTRDDMDHAPATICGEIVAVLLSSNGRTMGLRRRVNSLRKHACYAFTVYRCTSTDDGTILYIGWG